MVKNLLIYLPFLFMANSCKSLQSSQNKNTVEPLCKLSTTKIDQEGRGTEDGVSCRATEIYRQELRVLVQETPLILKPEFFFADFGYPDFPSEIFARKGGLSAADRLTEKTPSGSSDSAAHRFLMRIAQQIFQQALLAKITQNTAHADNVLMITNKIVKAQLRFKNDPNNPLETNDNRYLEFGWFLTAAARGVNIVNQSMSEQWKTEHKWNEALHDFNDWIGEGINQNWDIKYALKQSPLNIVSQTGTMNWVGTIDTQFGATNRTFAMLEAQFRIAELRGGKLGPVILIPNAWQQKQQFPKQHDGSIAVLFETFRGYLKYYFNQPITNNPKEFVLKSDPSLVVLNNNPEKADELPCGDPLKLGYRALCGLNKDAYRNDTYHPQMGLASVLHIIELGKRYGLELTDDEHQRVIKGLRWASFNNVDGVTAASAHGIPLWELAFRLYSADELGPYCQRDLLANRSQDEFKKAALAWGYTELTGGY